MQKASERLEEATQAILENPPKHDECGRILDDKTLNYRDAFDFACVKNPDLVKEYITELNGGLSDD